ncbi:MAG: hypothetical protein EBS07_09720, partial [Sphingobacteriia bacterium]|nr:hypothetical protein [Sphingobacteriia bacterium]
MILQDKLKHRSGRFYSMASGAGNSSLGSQPSSLSNTNLMNNNSLSNSQPSQNAIQQTSYGYTPSNLVSNPWG